MPLINISLYKEVGILEDLLIALLDFCKTNNILFTVLPSLIFIVLIILFCFIFYKTKILPLLNLYTQKRIQEKEQEETFKKNTEDIELLKQEYNEIKKNTKTANEKLNVLSMMLLEMQEKEDKKERARLKNTISSLYRECHASGKWTQMEKDTMEDMIDSYESCNGKNSFVHDTVQKEMYTWEIVDE